MNAQPGVNNGLKVSVSRAFLMCQFKALSSLIVIEFTGANLCLINYILSEFVPKKN